MKSFFITLLIGALLIGGGTAVTVFELSEWDNLDNKVVIEDVFGERMDTEVMYLSTKNKNQKVKLYVPKEARTQVIVDETMTDDIKIEVAYNKEILEYRLHEYGLSNENEIAYDIEIYMDLSPKEVMEALRYCLKNKVIFSTYENVERHRKTEIKIYVNEQDKNNLDLNPRY